jgi:uncharacterized UBP type Zn finger protein
MSTWPWILKPRHPCFYKLKKEKTHTGMNISFTSRLKVALLVLVLSLSILIVTIIFDTWGIRSHSPKTFNTANSATVTVLPSEPKPKPKTKTKTPPIPNPKIPSPSPKINTDITQYNSDDETDSESISNGGSSPGGGGGGGGGILLAYPAPLAELKEIKLLFQVDNPVSINFDDPKIADSDFIDQLPDMPLRTSGFVGISNKGNSCYADATLQMLYRMPFIRKVLANFGVYYERAKKIVKEKTDRIKSLEDQKEADSQSEISRLSRDLEDITKAASVLEGLNHMFHQLHSGTSSANFSFERTMQCMPDIFAGFGQQDAFEYLIAILGSIKDFLPPSQHHHFMFNLVYGGTEICPKDPSYTFIRSETITPQTNIILDLKEIMPPAYDFLGNLLVEPEENLDVLISKYFSDEIINGVKLENGCEGQLKKYTKFASLSEILIIQLKRLIDFEQNIKRTEDVIMPLEYDFGQLIGNGHPSVKYRLKMFIEHIGKSGSSGHYVAHHREADGKWVTYNDSSVYGCSNIYDELNVGYIYFYERII